MKAAVITRPFNVEIMDVKKPEIEEGQILVQSKVVSICGSDMPHFLNERPMQYPLFPGIPGHECIGVVAQTRSKSYKEGDEVLSLPNEDRGFAEFFVTTPERTVSLPHIKDKYVVAQPLGTVIHACKKLFQPLFQPYVSDNEKLDIDSWSLKGKSVAIIGQGSIGLLFTSLMKMFNADVIIGIDPIDYRLNIAKSMGATHVINPYLSSSFDMVNKITDGKLVDLTIEAVGKDSTVNDCFPLTRRNGVVLAFGVPRKTLYDFLFPEFFNKEIKLIGSLGPNVQLEFPVAVDMVVNERINVEQIISHRMAFDDIQKAFEMAAEKKDNAIKIIMKV